MLEMIKQILDFWFLEEATQLSSMPRALWDEECTEYDSVIKHKFEELHYMAVQGKLNSWLRQPKSCLAFIILMHQFPKRMYRSSPTAYQFDGLAIKASDRGRDRKLDKELDILEKVFFYAPYIDSEELTHQRLSLALLQKLIAEAKECEHRCIPYLEKSNRRASDSYVIIQNFGRFPARNEILERESTQEELVFLGLPNNFC